MTSDTPKAPAWPVTVAIGVLVIEAIAVAGLIVLYGVEMGSSDQDDAGRSLASIGLFVVGLVLLIAMVLAWRRGSGWQRMATLVLNALLIPVAFSAIRAWGVLLGAPVLVLAVIGIVAALAASATPDEA